MNIFPIRTVALETQDQSESAESCPVSVPYRGGDERIDRMEEAIRQFLHASGVPGDDPHLLETPLRVARTFCNELLRGYQVQMEDIFKTFEEAHDPVVVVRDIPFYSLCAHHMLPFHGTASIGYQPSGRVVGLSKMARLVSCLAHRLQVQERLTGQIVDAIETHLSPRGVAVLLRAEHMCMSMRGVSKPGAQTVTYVARGEFEKDVKAGERIFDLLKSP